MTIFREKVMNFRRLLSRITIDQSTFPITSFAVVNIIRSIIQENFLETLFSFMLLFEIIFFYSFLPKCFSKYLWAKMLLVREYFNLLINALIMINMLTTYQTQTLNHCRLIEGIKIGICECIFLNLFQSALVKFLSILVFVLFILGKYDLETYDFFLIVLAVFLFGAYFNNRLKKEKQLISKSDAAKLLADPSKTSNFMNSLLIDSSDLIFMMSDSMKIEYSNAALNDFLISQNLKLNNIIKMLQTLTFMLKKEFSEKVDVSEIYKEVFNKLSDSQIFDNKISFKDLFNKIFAIDINKTFLLVETKMFDEQNDVIFIIRENQYAFFKIKRDYLYEELIKSNITSDNYTHAISFVAHEFRTPLNCIVSMLQNLGQSIENGLVNSYIVPAISSSKFLLNLVNDLLDIAQIEAGVFKLVRTEFELHLLIENTFEIITYQAVSRGIELILDLDPEIRKVNSDPNRIRQIITNLLSKIYFLFFLNKKIEQIKDLSNYLLGNALKYTTKGSITISTRRISPEDVELAVTDSGIGISKDNLSRLFKAFGKIKTQTDAALNSQGVGLGLLISNKLGQQLSKNHEGIIVESIVGKGSTFRICLYDSPITIGEECIATISSHRVNKMISLESRMLINVSGVNSYQTKTLSNSLEWKNSLNENKSEKKLVFEVSKNLYPSSVAISCSRLSNSKNSFVKTASSHGVKSIDKLRSCLFIGDSHQIKDLHIKDYVERDSFIEKKIESLKIIMKLRKCNCPLALVIDDNDFNILALTTHLNRMEVKTQSALSADAAMDLIREMASNDCCNNFKIIFLDIEMPRKNGFEAFEEIKQFYLNEDIPFSTIIAVTAHSYGGETFNAIQKSGIHHILTKPLSLESLIITLKKIMSNYNFV